MSLNDTAGSGGSAKSLPWLVASAAAGAATWGTTYAWQEQLTEGQPAKTSASQHGSCLDTKWVQKIAAGSDNAMVLSASAMHNHPLLKKDHLVSTKHPRQMLKNAQMSSTYCTNEHKKDQKAYCIPHCVPD